RLELTGLDRRFERALDVADQARRRQRERDHELVPDARWKRRLNRVFGGERRDLLAELVDERDATALLFGALGRDVRAREAQEIVESSAHLAGEAADRARRPLAVVLARAQVVQHQEAHG